MSLQLIIVEMKALGNLTGEANRRNLNNSYQQIDELRKFRVKIGSEQFISKQNGQFVSGHELIFRQPFSYVNDHCSHMLYIQIFKPHKFLDNSDLGQIMTAEVDLSDMSNLNGEYIQTALMRVSGEQVGKLILVIQTFKKGQKYFEKVSSKVFFEAVKQEKDKQIQASEAAKNIRHLMVNNTLADTLMTINAMTLIMQKQEPDIFMRQGFILIKYGLTIRAYSSLLKMTSKESVNWMDYIQFLKNQGVKFQFFFMHYDQLGVLICKAKGQIKYVTFDETINLHSITMFDKRSAKYGTLMVKFNQKLVDKVNINNKVDKKIKQQEALIQKTIEDFNQFKFQNKNNNHILSEKMWELEQQAQAKEEEKTKPLNPEEKKKQEEHSKFIQFLQKEMIKIQRELIKREQNNKKQEKKKSYLPTVDNKKIDDSRVVSTQKRQRSMNNSFSAAQFQNGTKFPKI